MAVSGKGTDPKKLISTAVALGMVLLVAWVLVLSQAKSGAQGETAYEQARIESLRTTLGRDVPGAAKAPRPEDSFGNAWLVFVFLSAALGGVWWFFGRKESGRLSLPPFPIVTEQEFGPGQKIVVLEAGPEYWVFSITPQQINLVYRSSKQDAAWLGSLKSERTEAPAFASVLKAFTGDRT